MVEIWTDASWNPEDNTGGYGIIIEGDDDTFQYQGNLQNVVDPHQAELEAIYIATNFLKRVVDPTTVIFWTDSMTCYDLVNKGRERKYPKYRDLLDLIYQNLIGYRYVINYVARNSTPQHELCDINSKLYSNG